MIKPATDNGAVNLTQTPTQGGRRYASTSASDIAASDGPTFKFTTRMEGSAYSMTAFRPRG